MIKSEWKILIKLLKHQSAYYIIWGYSAKIPWTTLLKKPHRKLYAEQLNHTYSMYAQSVAWNFPFYLMTLNEYQITCTYFFIFFPFFIVSLGFCLEYYAIINRFTWFLFSPWIVPNKNVFDSVFYPKKNNQLWQQKNSFHKKKHVELDWIAYLLKWCIQMHAFWNRIIFDYIDTDW